MRAASPVRAAIFRQTSTIGLGTFVVQLGSRSPALLATSALSLQSLSGGRFTLGVGRGPRGSFIAGHGFERDTRALNDDLAPSEPVVLGPADVAVSDGVLTIDLDLPPWAVVSLAPAR